jgi:hypothetical protein
MRKLDDLQTPHGELAKEFVQSLDKTLNIYINVFDDVYVSGVKNGQIVYRKFKPWS